MQMIPLSLNYKTKSKRIVVWLGKEDNKSCTIAGWDCLFYMALKTIFETNILHIQQQYRN